MIRERAGETLRTCHFRIETLKKAAPILDACPVEPPLAPEMIGDQRLIAADEIGDVANAGGAVAPGREQLRTRRFYRGASVEQASLGFPGSGPSLRHQAPELFTVARRVT